MKFATRYFSIPSFAGFTASAAVVLGILMTAGGAGLVIAVFSTVQPPLQSLTAFVLTASGLANLLASRGVYAKQHSALACSAAATMSLILYLGLGLRDFGEPFWLHGVYLLLLTTLAFRARLRDVPA